MRNLITGGAGFIGSHLINNLIRKNEEVICLDNYFTGTKSNIYKFLDNKLFELIRHDVTEPIRLEVDRVWHLACPASPKHYQINPIKTAKTSFIGTYNMLGLAKRVNAKFLLASTSEVYGDPEVHPQNESYWGSVNPIGIRSCYDEGKRIAETLCFDYQRSHNLDICIARIFNTYGPNMAKEDGRVISNFIVQALQGKDLTIYGRGTQTRSFCYVDDLVPVNIGSDQEFTILELAELVRSKINPKLNLVLKDLPEDDPKQRKPDLKLIKKELNWNPTVNLNNGLDKTINYFIKLIK